MSEEHRHFSELHAGGDQETCGRQWIPFVAGSRWTSASFSDHRLFTRLAVGCSFSSPDQAVWHWPVRRFEAVLYTPWQ
jgi:hypothetical protein